MEQGKSCSIANNNHRMTDWKENIHKAQNGDKRAYATLLRDIASLLRGYLIKRLNNTGEVEDIIQETLIGISNTLHTYNTDRPFKPWLFAIANYKLNDYFRKLYRRTEFSSVDFEKIEPTLGEDVTEAREISEYVHKGLRSLPEKQRRIVHMMKLDGYSAREVAEHMNMSTSAVKVSAHRAYKSLKKYMIYMDE